MARLIPFLPMLLGMMTVCAQPEMAPWKRGLVELWTHLGERHESLSKLHELEIAGTRIQRDQIGTQKHLTQQGDATVSQSGATVIQSTMKGSINDWGGEGAVVSEDRRMASVRIGGFRTFFSGRERKLALLDSAAEVQRMRFTTETEALLMAEWKAVLAEKIGYDLMDAEIHDRTECLAELARVEGMLEKLRSEGEVAANILSPIALFRKDNDLRMRSLEAQKRLQIGMIRSKYRIPDSLFLALKPDSLEAALAAETPSRPYDFRIDSLSFEENRLRFMLASMPQSGMEAGLGFDFGSFTRPEDVKVYARLAFDFSWFDHKPLPGPPGVFPKPSPFPTSGEIETIAAQVSGFEKEAELLMGESVEKMKFGRIGSALEISDLVQRKLNQKTQLAGLRAFRSQEILATLEDRRQIALDLPGIP